MPEVLGHLAAAAEDIVLLREVRPQHLTRRHAHLQRRAQVAVVHAEPVVPAFEVRREGDLSRLVAGASDVKEALPLLEQDQHLVVQLARGHHRAQHGFELGRVEVLWPDGQHVQVALRARGVGVLLGLWRGVVVRLGDVLDGRVARGIGATHDIRDRLDHPTDDRARALGSAVEQGAAAGVVRCAVVRCAVVRRAVVRCAVTAALVGREEGTRDKATVGGGERCGRKRILGVGGRGLGVHRSQKRGRSEGISEPLPPGGGAAPVWAEQGLRQRLPEYTRGPLARSRDARARPLAGRARGDRRARAARKRRPYFDGLLLRYS